MRQTDQAIITRPATVESLDNKRSLHAECCDLSFRHAQTESLDELKAKIFVFNTVRQVHAVWQSADLRLDNVCRWGRVGRFDPLPFVVEQRGLVLGSSHRDAEIVLASNAEWIFVNIRQ